MRQNSRSWAINPCVHSSSNTRQIGAEVALARVQENGYPDALAVRIIEGEHLIRIVMPAILGEDHSQPRPRRWLEALIEAHEQRGPRPNEQIELELFEPDRRR